MTTIVTRLYTDAARASAAATTQRRLPGDRARVQQIDAAGQDAGRVAQALVALNVAPATAAAYAKEAVRIGGSLVVVRAAFGRAAEVIRELDWYEPVELDAPDGYFETVDYAAPLSDLLGVAVLSDNPTPLSSALGLKVLTKGTSNTNLIDNPAPFSNTLGLPLLKKGPGEKSFGFPLLKKGPGEKSFGFPLLSKNPAPLSSLFGLPTLSKNPTPLSSLLGLKTLTDDDDRR